MQRPSGQLTSGPYFVIVCTDEKWYNLLQDKALRNFGEEVMFRARKEASLQWIRRTICYRQRTIQDI